MSNFQSKKRVGVDLVEIPSVRHCNRDKKKSRMHIINKIKRNKIKIQHKARIRIPGKNIIEAPERSFKDVYCSGN